MINIRTLNIMDGHLPARVRGLVEEWAELNQQELINLSPRFERKTMITLTEAKYIDGYRIWIKFSDGLSGIVDFTDIIQNQPAARPLADQNEFQRFYLDHWPTLAWPCGFDFSPESLYERATGLTVPWLHNNQAEELTNA